MNHLRFTDKKHLAKIMFALTLCLALCACGGRYAVDTSGMTSEAAKIAELKAKYLEAQDWTKDMLYGYKTELSLRDPAMRKTIHAAVKPPLDALLLALNACDVALSMADGTTAQGEYERYLKLKAQLLAAFTRFAIKI